MSANTPPLPVISCADMRRMQYTAYADGTALRTHIESAHGGAFCAECAACRELKAKEHSV